MSDAPRYTEWDYDTRTQTEYERHGECNGCGDCCRVTITYTRVSPQSETTTGEGIWQEVDKSGERIFRKLLSTTFNGAICPELSKDNRCSCHGADKPTICQLWPVAPRDIEPFPRCGYSFVKIGEWPIQAPESAEGKNEAE